MIGTSGYSYPHWKFFYKGAPSLKKYAEHFDTVELNNTFYRFPTIDHIKKWKSEVPTNFIFAVKAPMLITHRNRLGPRAWPLIKKFLQVVKTFGKQLGPILFQFPPSFHCKPENVERIRKLINVCAKYTIAIEFRHHSWDEWRQKNVAVVIPINPATTLDEIKEMLARSTYIYLRFHPDKLYKKMLKKIWELIKAAGPKKIYVYFNNDLEGFALEDARTMRKISGVK
nr:hypothetical protein K-LCC10_0097 [Kaumoebavirus]